MHNFQKSLSKGKTGEDHFHQQYPILTRESGRGADFSHPDIGTIELKTDFYTNPKNFFLETHVQYETQLKPGGPFQSQEKNIKWFVYQFATTKQEFWFDVNKLCAFAIDNQSKYRLVEVRNKKWTGFGLLIPISVLSLISDACPIDKKNA